MHALTAHELAFVESVLGDKGLVSRVSWSAEQLACGCCCELGSGKVCKTHCDRGRKATPHTTGKRTVVAALAEREDVLAVFCEFGVKGYSYVKGVKPGFAGVTRRASGQIGTQLHCIFDVLAITREGAVIAVEVHDVGHRRNVERRDNDAEKYRFCAVAGVGYLALSVPDRSDVPRCAMKRALHKYISEHL